MAGLLSQGFADPRSEGMGLIGLAHAIAPRNRFVGGLLEHGQNVAQAQDRDMRRGLLNAQLTETLAQAQERQIRAQREQAEAERQARIRAAMPSLFRQGGMAGGEAVTQEMGGVPMFSKPANVAPMQQTAGGFDLQRALALGATPDEITKMAGLSSIGRAKVARTVEVDDGKGGKMTVQLDEFGQRVGAGLPGFIPPVQVNQGDRVSFVRPTAGVSMPVGMSPAERDASARGWTTLRLQQEQKEQGKWQYDAARGGLVNMQTGEFKAATQNGQPIETKASREAEKEELRRRGAVAQADSVLKEIRDAKGMVGWNTAGVGGALSFVPATDARDLSAKLQTIKANLGFDRLQQMRQESPTGGALGAVAVQELAALQSTVASLDQLQSPAQLGAALDKIEQHYTNWLNAVKEAGAGSTGGASGGWGIREKK